MTIAAALLAGCAHVEVHDFGNGQHFLTATAPSGGFYGSHEEAVEKANDFCARTAKPQSSMVFMTSQ